MTVALVWLSITPQLPRIYCILKWSIIRIKRALSAQNTVDQLLGSSKVQVKAISVQITESLDVIAASKRKTSILAECL